MTLARENAYVGGRAFRKARHGSGAGGAAVSYQLQPVTILEIMRGGCKVQLANGKETMCGWSELEEDEHWLDARDRAEEQKKARIRAESQPPALELVSQPKPAPLTASLGDIMAAKKSEAPAQEAPAQPKKRPGPNLDSPSSQAVREQRGEAGAYLRDFAARLQLLLEMRQIKGSRLNKALGVKAAVGNWIHAMCLPQPALRPKLAQLLGVSEDELMDVKRDLPELPTLQAPLDIFRRIDALRLSRGFASISALNAAAGLANGTLARRKTGEYGPSDETLGKLAAVLGVTQNVLLGWEPMPDANKSAPAPNARIVATRQEAQDAIRVLLEKEEGAIRARAADKAKAPTPPKQSAPPHPEAVDDDDEPAPLAIRPSSTPLDMWLEMGRRMSEPMRQELQRVRAEIKRLLPVRDQYNQLVAQRDELKRQLAMVEQMTGGSPHAPTDPAR